jgi:hypothetical protein
VPVFRADIICKNLISSILKGCKETLEMLKKRNLSTQGNFPSHWFIEKIAHIVKKGK